MGTRAGLWLSPWDRARARHQHGARDTQRASLAAWGAQASCPG